MQSLIKEQTYKYMLQKYLKLYTGSINITGRVHTNSKHDSGRFPFSDKVHTGFR